MNDTTPNEAAEPFRIDDFLNVGLNAVAYIKPIETPDGPGFAVHGANGMRYAVAADQASAFGFIKQQDMEPVSLN